LTGSIDTNRFFVSHSMLVPNGLNGGQRLNDWNDWN